LLLLQLLVPACCLLLGSGERDIQRYARPRSED
jgi:hypothetical protein